MTDALTLRNINKWFGKFEALRDVSFSLNKGEFLTMLGPSGSGKTTTLRVIAGFEGVSSGTMLLDGKDVARLPPNKRNIGMVFQDYALFPHMSVAQNVAFPLEARGIARPRQAQMVGEMLEVVGLSGMADRMVRQMSGGQQQRVALARALVFQPQILLLDEPMAALDKKLRSQVQLEILRITRQLGATVISVTHDQEEAMVMSDRIALFRAGQIEQLGRPQDLYTAPRTRFVADFIGDANILPGRVESVQGGVARLASGGEHFLAPATPGIAVGAKMDTIIRPEKIDVTRGPSDAPQMVLEQVVYLGVECRLVGRLGDSPVQVRSRDLSLMQAQPGERLGLRWRPDDAILLAHSQ